jgi:heme-degrading monooxygenase HmoA
MIARIWRTEIDETRADEYREFAHVRSLPMFRAQPGFAGVLFAAQGAQRAVISLWDNLAAAEALNHSPTYTATVAALEATGFLRGDSALEVLELEGIFLEDGSGESVPRD